MGVTFIHTGDLHLGRQFRFKHRSDIFGREKRTDLWNAFKKIVNTAQRNAVDLLLITGDLFDSPEMDVTMLMRVAEILGKLTVTRTVILPGNHDFYSSITLYGLVDWPENVTVFTGGRVESVYFPELNTEIYGFGWTKNTYTEMPGKPIPIPENERQNIFMLHGDAKTAGSCYMPLDLMDFDAYDYIALGHFHRYYVLSEKAFYCGSPEALDFGETGVHGFVYGQLRDHHLRTEFVPLSGREYHTITFKVEPDMTYLDIYEGIATDDETDSHFRDYFRVRLEGYIDPQVDLKGLRDELASNYYYFELDESALEPDLDLDCLEQENTAHVIGEFIREMRKYGEDPIAKKALYLGLSGLR